MTRDDIIRLAREAGFVGWLAETPFVTASFEHFAALVAAAEHDRMKSEGWRQCAEGQRTTQYCGLLGDAVKAEREECAKACEENLRDEYLRQARPIQEEVMLLAAIADCAAAIRARGNT